MNRGYLILMSIPFMFMPLMGQQNNNVVYLKDGSILHGQILENNSDNIKLALAENTIILPNSAIEHIKNNHTDINKKSWLSGYYNLTSIGVLIGSTVNEKVAPASLLMEHNYLFGNHISIGTTLGFEWLNEIVCPVALNLKFLLPVKNSNFYISTSGGHSFSIENPEEYAVTKGKGGNLFNAEIGYIISASDYTGFYFAFGYRYNELHYDMEDWWWDNASRTMYFNRFVIRTGIIIN